MEWIERRAGLIGVGALVVAALALGVAISDRGGHDRRMIRMSAPGFLQPYGAPGLEGGPMMRRYDGGPGLTAPGGGPMVQRFGVTPGQKQLGGGMPGFIAGGGALHGELTLPAPNGKYQTIDLQRGTVTSVSSSSLTVKSDDGFTKTYAIPKSLASRVAKGDQVELRAAVVNGKATVTGLRTIRSAMR